MPIAGSASTEPANPHLPAATSVATTSNSSRGIDVVSVTPVDKSVAVTVDGADNVTSLSNSGDAEGEDEAGDDEKGSEERKRRKDRERKAKWRADHKEKGPDDVEVVVEEPAKAADTDLKKLEERRQKDRLRKKKWRSQKENVEKEKERDRKRKANWRAKLNETQAAQLKQRDAERKRRARQEMKRREAEGGGEPPKKRRKSTTTADMEIAENTIDSGSTASGDVNSVAAVTVSSVSPEEADSQIDVSSAMDISQAEISTSSSPSSISTSLSTSTPASEPVSTSTNCTPSISTSLSSPFATSALLGSAQVEGAILGQVERARSRSRGRGRGRGSWRASATGEKERKLSQHNDSDVVMSEASDQSLTASADSPHPHEGRQDAMGEFRETGESNSQRIDSTPISSLPEESDRTQALRSVTDRNGSVGVDHIAMVVAPALAEPQEVPPTLAASNLVGGKELKTNKRKQRATKAVKKNDSEGAPTPL